jgi:fructose 1,6-bisphosphatase
MPTDEAVVETAAEAAEGLVLDRLKTSDVDDLDITVTFEDGVLDVDVYVRAPDADADVEQVADDAALAAQAAVDDLFAGDE